MAARYWVGGSATWNATAGSKWALTSGGAGGEAVPTSSDDVFFDGNSGASVVTMGTDGNCLSLTCTGFTGTIRDNGSGFLINAYGNVTIGSGMTWSFTGGAGLIMQASGTLTTNGVTMTGALQIDSGTLTLGDAAAFTGVVNVFGTLDTAGFAFSTTNTATGIDVYGTLDMGASTVTTPKVTVQSGGTLDFGSGTLTVSGTGTCVSVNASGTITAGTGTLKITNSSSSSKTLSLQGKTYYTLWIATGSTGFTTIQGSNTFNGDLKITTTTGDVRFTAGTTQTVVGNLDWNGSAGNDILVRSSSNGSAWNISKSSGTVTVTFCSIRDSAAAGGATFIAENSTNVSGNTGWIFKAVGLLGFGRLLPF